MALNKGLLALAGTSLLIPTLAQALTIQHVRVTSVIGEPFRAEVTVTDIGGLTSAQLQGSLASDADFQLLGVNQNSPVPPLSFETRIPSPERGVITITSRQPIQDPYLDFVMRIGGGRNVRLQHITALIDPPASTRRTMTAAAPVSLPPVVAPSTVNSTYPKNTSTPSAPVSPLTSPVAQRVPTEPVAPIARPAISLPVVTRIPASPAPVVTSSSVATSALPTASLPPVRMAVPSQTRPLTVATPPVQTTAARFSPAPAGQIVPTGQTAPLALPASNKPAPVVPVTPPAATALMAEKPVLPAAVATAQPEPKAPLIQTAEIPLIPLRQSPPPMDAPPEPLQASGPPPVETPLREPPKNDVPHPVSTDTMVATQQQVLEHPQSPTATQTPAETPTQAPTQTQSSTQEIAPPPSELVAAQTSQPTVVPTPPEPSAVQPSPVQSSPAESAAIKANQTAEPPITAAEAAALTAELQAAEKKSASIPPLVTSASGSIHYQVQGQDSLWKIAQRLQPELHMSVPQLVTTLHRLNQQAFVHGNPNQLRKGVHLVLPPQARELPMSGPEHQPTLAAKPARSTLPPTTVNTGKIQPAPRRGALPRAEMTLIAPGNDGLALGNAKQGRTQGDQPLSTALATSVGNARARTKALQSDISQLTQRLQLNDRRLAIQNARLAELEQRLKARREAKRNPMKPANTIHAMALGLGLITSLGAVHNSTESVATAAAMHLGVSL